MHIIYVIDDTKRIVETDDVVAAPNYRLFIIQIEP